MGNRIRPESQTAGLGKLQQSACTRLEVWFKGLRVDAYAEHCVSRHASGALTGEVTEALEANELACLHLRAGFFEQLAAEGVLNGLARLTSAAWE